MQTLKKLLSISLVFLLLFILPISGLNHTIAENETREPQTVERGIALETEEIDPSTLNVKMLGEIGEDSEMKAEEPEEIDPNEVVRVSIFLEGNATIDQGFSTKEIAKNTRAVAYRRALELQQKTIQTKIEGAIGRHLDVKWNLTLLTNAISVEIPYKDIEIIKQIPGVKSVERENAYQVPEPVDETTTGKGDTKTGGTAEHMVGATTAWAAGYTGAGTRIAIIDSGIDDTHQSFNEDAFLYAIEEDRASGKTVELMEQIDEETLNQLNAKICLPSLTAEETYRSAKIPFAFNYVDQSTITDHLHDRQGSHGSHVAGIAAANRYIKNGDNFDDAFSTVHAVGMAPDAQLIVMKVFGGRGSEEFDSDIIAAVEDAIILDCDAVNLSLGQYAPAFTYNPTYHELYKRLASGTDTKMVVSYAAGNSYGLITSYREEGPYLEDINNFDCWSGTQLNTISVASADNIVDMSAGTPIVIQDRENAVISEFSSWGVPGSLLLKPDITAPGGNIYSVFGTTRAFGGGSDQYVLMSGTSMAVPHISGLAAIIAQYLRENPIENEELTDNFSTRAIIQSLLMSTATPMKNDGEYVSLLRQGAGLVEVSKAIQASSVIMIDDAYLTTATGTNQDGKVKAELGDDPEKTGDYTYSFDIYNVTDYPLEYTFRTDLFTQGIETADDGDHLSGTTTELCAVVTHTLVADGAATGHDVDRDGDTDNDDVQAILDYLTGLRAEAECDLSVADMDSDGSITSHDAHLLIDWTPEEGESISENVVPAHGKAKVTVNIRLNDVKLDNYPNGAYIEGFTYATCNSVSENGTETIDLSHEHTIPILGFYGNWTDPSMFDCVSYVDQMYGTKKESYTGRYSNTLTYSFNGRSYQVAGNPFMLEKAFHPERLAIRSDAVIEYIEYVLYRGAGTVGYAVSKLDAPNGNVTDVIQSKVVGNNMDGFYWDSGSGSWKNLNPRRYSVSGTADSLGLHEDDVFRVGFYALPELSAMKVNDDLTDAYAGMITDDETFAALIESNQLGSGAAVAYDFTIDDTAPEIGEVTLNEETGEMTIDVSDNHNVAYVALTSIDGAVKYAEKTVGAQATTVTIDATSAINDATMYIAVFIGDYAGNATAKVVKINDHEFVSVEAYILFDPTTDTIDPDAEYLIAEPNADSATSETRYRFICCGYIAFSGSYTLMSRQIAVHPGDDSSDQKSYVIGEDVVSTGSASIRFKFVPQESEDEYKIVAVNAGSGKLGLKAPTSGTDPTLRFVAKEKDAANWLYRKNTSNSINRPTLRTMYNNEEYYLSYSNSAFSTAPQQNNVAFFKKGYIRQPVDVNPYRIKDLSVNPTNVTMIVGNSIQLTVSVNPLTADPSVTWESLDPTVATVDEDGIVRSISAGETTIIATSVSQPEVTDSAIVTVEDPEIAIKKAEEPSGEVVEPEALEPEGTESENAASEDTEADPISASEVCMSSAVKLSNTGHANTGTITALASDDTRNVGGSSDFPAQNIATVVLSENEASTNGLFTVSYDPSELILVDATGIEAYSSVKIDEAAGTIKVAYAAKHDITARETIATVHFTAATCTRTKISVTTTERGERAALNETAFIKVIGLGHDWGEPTYIWYNQNENVTATVACKTCKASLTESTKTTAKVTQEPTPGKPGILTYTATFRNGLFTTQIKNIKIYALSPEIESNEAKPAKAEMDPDDVEFSGKTPYSVYNGKAQTPGVIVKDENGRVIPASKYKVEYTENVKPGTAYIFVTFPNKDYTDCSVWFKIYLPATTSTTVKNVDNGIQISWKKVESAKGYVIYRRAWSLNGKGWTSFERWNNTTQTTWIDTKVYAGTRYQYGIKAYFNDPMDNYNLGLVGPLKTTVRITTRVLNSVTPASKKLTVKWTGSSLFTGYQVQIATDAAFSKDLQTVTIADAKTYEKAITSLKAGTTYYVRVRSYHVFDSTTYYGQWSNVMNSKTK